MPVVTIYIHQALVVSIVAILIFVFIKMVIKMIP